MMSHTHIHTHTAQTCGTHLLEALCFLEHITHPQIERGLFVKIRRSIYGRSALRPVLAGVGARGARPAALGGDLCVGDRGAELAV